MQSENDESRLTSCQTYFDLIEKVGSKGRFQKRLVVLFVWALYSGGVAQLGPTFFFIMQSYSCQEQGLLSAPCSKHVCSLPASAQEQFLSPSFNAYTIPVQYGYQQCIDSEEVSAVLGFVYFGFLVAVFLRAFVVDSLGRRPLMIFFNGIMVLGSGLSVSSINIWVSGFGFFLLNCGADGAIKSSMNYLAEYYHPRLREKYSVIIQLFYSVGYLLVCLSSFLISDWRITAGIFIILPAVAGFIFCFYYLPEIPRYLVKQGEERMLEVLNRIAMINGREVVTREDLISVAQHKETKLETARVNLMALCRHSSLRRVSVLYCLALFMIMTLYYGSSILVDSFGLNTYLVGVILACADFTVYIPAFTLISSLKRKTTSLLLSATIAAAAAALIFIEKPDDCHFCATAIFEIILLFVFRFSVNFLYVLVLIYSNELFPEKVRAASSILELLGGLSMVINPALLNLLQKADINPMIYFAFIALLCIAIYSFLPETNGLIREEIEEEGDGKGEGEGEEEGKESGKTDNSQLINDSSYNS